MTEFAQELLKKHYCRPDETIEEAFKRACNCFASDPKHSNRLYDYIDRGWFMFSSPILSNAVKTAWDTGDTFRKIYIEKPKGLPISCFKAYVPDSIKGLCEHTTEERWLSVKGGGVGGHWSDVRSISDITPGVLGFLHTVDADMVAYRQGKTRRGSYASYLNIDHPEIIDFIKMRTPTGDLNRKNLNLHHGVNITDDFIDAVDKDLMWCLVDPHSGMITDRIKARELWEEILTTRFRTGEPYINYIDEANDKLHPALKAKGLKIHGSNLCNEIHLPTDTDRTAVCCLSSVNLAVYDEWKDDEYFIGDLVEMLDNVITYFINFAPSELHRATYSAMRERSIGLGAMGFADYLQSKMIPWESAMAISINKGMFKNIKDKALAHSKYLAAMRGEAPDGQGYGVRNLHLMAIAPNANSSIILGVSPSIEPRHSNCYTQKTRVGSYLVKNPELEEYFFCNPRTEDYDMEDIWKSILEHNGSVQHLPDDLMTEDDKKVFRTAFEIDQHWVVLQARVRQEFICQGQSVNLFFEHGADRSYVNSVHRKAFTTDEVGVPLKGLYYLRTESASKIEKVNVEIRREALQDGVQGELSDCLACQG